MNPLLNKPSSDFNSVRDGRTSLPLYIDVDLTTARSIGANNQLVIEIAANSFYADADTTNGGNATVHFQDTNLGSSSAPFFVSPGFIANVGFTKLLIENTAQAGKRLRIFYGVDIDFQAGVNSSISISGAVTVSNSISSPVHVDLNGYSFGTSYQSVTAMAANTPDTVFLAAANTNGAIIYDLGFANNSAGIPYAGFITKNGAPASLVDGTLLLSSDSVGMLAGSFMTCGSLKSPIKIPAGVGLYYISSAAESSCVRRAKYTLLP